MLNNVARFDNEGPSQPPSRARVTSPAQDSTAPVEGQAPDEAVRRHLQAVEATLCNLRGEFLEWLSARPTYDDELSMNAFQYSAPLASGSGNRRVADVGRAFTVAVEGLASDEAVRRHLHAVEATLCALRGEYLEWLSARSPAPLSSESRPTVAAGSGNRRVDDVVRIMSSTGLCRAKDIKKRLAAEWLVANSSTAERHTKAAAAQGYIEKHNVALESGGRASAKIFSLTEKGRALAAQLGAPRAPSQYERGLALHKSLDHLYLILDVVDVLSAEGWQSIDPFPPALPLPDGGAYHPDIVGFKNGEAAPLFVEVERDTRKDQTVRPSKWLRAAQAGDGVIHLATANKNAMQSILSEIAAIASQNPDQPVRVRGLDIRGYRDGARFADGSIWLWRQE